MVPEDVGAARPVASDDVVAPATWSAREPDGAWCPAALSDALDEAFIATAAVEPRIELLQHGAWTALGASVRGRSHHHRGEYRDDALAAVSRNGLLILAVADGAGSSALSRIGAAVTAQLAVDRTVSRYEADAHNGDATSRLGTAMAHAVHDAAIRLHDLATIGGVASAALRTTLVLVAIAGDLTLVCQVGDGAVLVQKTDGTVLRVGATRETAWAGEVTCFVPDACAMTQAAELRQLRTSDLALIALMTDGVDDPFHPLEQSGDTLVGQWRNGTSEPIGVARQVHTPPVLGNAEALLQWLSFEQRGEVDDRTLLLAWRDVSVAA